MDSSLATDTSMTSMESLTELNNDNNNDNIEGTIKISDDKNKITICLEKRDANEPLDKACKKVIAMNAGKLEQDGYYSVTEDEEIEEISCSSDSSSEGRDKSIRENKPKVKTQIGESNSPPKTKLQTGGSATKVQGTNSRINARAMTPSSCCSPGSVKGILKDCSSPRTSQRTSRSPCSVTFSNLVSSERCKTRTTCSSGASCDGKGSPIRRVSDGTTSEFVSCYCRKSSGRCSVGDWSYSKGHSTCSRCVSSLGCSCPSTCSLPHRPESPPPKDPPPDPPPEKSPPPAKRVQTPPPPPPPKQPPPPPSTKPKSPNPTPQTSKTKVDTPKPVTPSPSKTKPVTPSSSKTKQVTPSSSKTKQTQPPPPEQPPPPPPPPPPPLQDPPKDPPPPVQPPPLAVCPRCPVRPLCCTLPPCRGTSCKTSSTCFNSCVFPFASMSSRHDRISSSSPNNKYSSSWDRTTSCTGAVRCGSDRSSSKTMKASCVPYYQNSKSPDSSCSTVPMLKRWKIQQYMAHEEQKKL